MKNILKFIIFIAYTFGIFLINDKIVLGLLFFLNVVLMISLKVSCESFLNYLKLILPFIGITMLINFSLGGINEAILIGVRIMMCFHITYLYSKTMTVTEIANMIQSICFPLKWIGINTNSISIMISISICMIPIFRKEIHTRIQAMKSKGKIIRINNYFMILKPMLISVLRRTSQMEKSLMAKAYQEE